MLMFVNSIGILRILFIIFDYLHQCFGIYINNKWRRYCFLRATETDFSIFLRHFYSLCTIFLTYSNMLFKNFFCGKVLYAPSTKMLFIFMFSYFAVQFIKIFYQNIMAGFFIFCIK